MESDELKKEKNNSWEKLQLTEELINNKTVEEVSADFLLSVRKKEEYTEYFKVLNKMNWEDINDELNTDEAKKAFWINLYNALTLIQMRDSKLKKQYPNSSFFNYEILILKNLKLCLNDIEHKILRRSKILYCLGYMERCCIPQWERSLRVDKFDYRIHFALNCGATSCPPISRYVGIKIDRQLEIATKSYIIDTSKVDYNNKNISCSKIFFWFKGDFGGGSGVLQIHKKYFDNINSSFSINYLDYNWTVEEKYVDN